MQSTGGQVGQPLM